MPVLPVLTDVREDLAEPQALAPVATPPAVSMPAVSLAAAASQADSPADSTTGSPTNSPTNATTAPSWPTPSTQAELVQQVMELLVPRLDMLLELRSNQVLGPALTQAVQGLVRAAQQDMAPALREVAVQAVAEVLAKGGQALPK